MAAGHLYPIEVRGKCGFIDQSGQVVIKPQFAECYEFHDGLASFAANDDKGERRRGFINTAGDVVIAPLYEHVGGFNEGLTPAAVRTPRGGQRWGYLDKTGAWAIEPKYEGASDFTDGLANVATKRDKRTVTLYLDRRGQTVLEVPGGRTGNFHEGLAWIEHPVKGQKRWTYIDKTAKTRIELVCTVASDFCEGRAMILQKNKEGYIDVTGRWIVPPQYAQAGDFHEGVARVGVFQPPTPDRFDQWHYAFINRDGEVILRTTYHLVGNCSEGLAWADFSKNPDRSQCGYIDMTGAAVIPPRRLDLAGDFLGGLAYVQLQGKIGYINRRGEYVWELQN